MTEKEPKIPVKTEMLTQFGSIWKPTSLSISTSCWHTGATQCIQLYQWDFSEGLGGIVEKDNSLVFTAGKGSKVF